MNNGIAAGVSDDTLVDLIERFTGVHDLVVNTTLPCDMCGTIGDTAILALDFGGECDIRVCYHCAYAELCE